MQFLLINRPTLIRKLVYDCLTLTGPAVINQPGKGFGSFWIGLLHRLLNEGELIIKWRTIKNKRNGCITVSMHNSLLNHK